MSSSIAKACIPFTFLNELKKAYIKVTGSEGSGNLDRLGGKGEEPLSLTATPSPVKTAIPKEVGRALVSTHETQINSIPEGELSMRLPC